MVNWDAYSTRLKAGSINSSISHGNYASSARNENVEVLKGDINDFLPSNPSYTTVNITLPDETEPKSVDMAVLSSDDMNIKYICGMPGDKIVGGSLVEWSDRLWLVVDVDPNYEVYQKAQMQMCNYTLKFRINDNIAVNKPCVIKDVTKYLIGETAKEMLTIGSSRMSVTVAKDKDTVYLNRGARLLIDDSGVEDSIAYEITKVDRVTGVYNGKGVYKYLVCETASTPDDDTVEMIPDDGKYEPGNPDEGGWF